MAGDAFVSVDNFPVTEQGDVSIVIGGKKPGDGVAVKVRRAGREMLFLPLLAAQPSHPAKP
jgi:S1-C subfamily serine protease